MSIWLIGTSRFKKAFSPPQSPKDPLVAESAAMLHSTDADDTGMGFHKLKRFVKDIVTVKKFLDEHGVSLEDSQISELMKYMKAVEEYERAKTRFWVQIVLSILIVGGSIGVLIFTAPPTEVSNSLFALLGLVIGFWFPRQEE